MPYPLFLRYMRTTVVKKAEITAFLQKRYIRFCFKNIKDIKAFLCVKSRRLAAFFTLHFELLGAICTKLA